MPAFSPELLRYLEAIAAPFRRLAESDSAFALGRNDKDVGLPNTMGNIAAKYSAPGRTLSIHPYGEDPGYAYRIKAHVPYTTTNPPSLDVIRNDLWEDTPQFRDTPTYDIDAMSATHGAKGKGTGTQMYPAAWDLIKSHGGVDMSSTLTTDNYLRKPAALLSYLLRGNSAKQVPFTGEMFMGADPYKHPELNQLMNELSNHDLKGNPGNYYFAPGGRFSIMAKSGDITPDQRIGGLALAESAKVQQRIGSMNHQVQDLWQDAQWPLEGKEILTNSFSPYLAPSSSLYLGHEHKIGDPTIRRALLTDWLAGHQKAGTPPEDIMKMLESEQGENFGKNLLYAKG